MFENEIELELPAGQRVMLYRAEPGDMLVLADWCDLHLQGDYFFKRRHLEGVIKRPNSKVYVILVNDVVGGLIILYRGSVLHNLYLNPEHRGGGIGSAVVQHFKPLLIRAKVDMIAGDPTGFYAKNGFKAIAADPALPHMLQMVPTSSPMLASLDLKAPLRLNGQGQPALVDPPPGPALPAAAVPALPGPAVETPPALTLAPAPPALQEPVKVPPLWGGGPAPGETMVEYEARLWRERQQRQRDRRTARRARMKGEGAVVALQHVASQVVSDLNAQGVQASLMTQPEPW